MGECANCPFGGFKVGSSGDLKSEIVIVGESPGVEEIRTKEPFVGPSGRLLWDSLNIPREQCYVTNAMKCFPGNKKNPTRLAKAARECRHSLLEEISQAPRKLIIAFGNAAVWGLTGDFGHKITQIRGKLIQSPLAELGILPVIHPAALLRGAGNVRQFKEDLHYGAHLLGYKGNGHGEGAKKFIVPNYTVEPLILHGSSLIAADIETEGFNRQRDKILCVGVAEEPNTVAIYNARGERPNLEQLQTLMEREDLRWIWHNGKFDIGFLRAAGFSQARVDEDTLLLSYTLDESAGVHDLEQVMSDLLGAPDYKHKLKPYVPKKSDSYAKIPDHVLHPYAAWDVSGTLQIFQKLRPKVAKDPDLEKLYTKVLLPASEMLTRVEERGIYVDQDKLEENDVKLQREMAKAEEALEKATGLKINPRSPQQVAHLLYDVLKLKHQGRSRGRSTDKEALSKLPPHAAVKALLHYRKVQKLHSTYVKGVYKALEASGDGRVHATFLLHGTRTGRLSSRNPNLQNIPRLDYIRSMFIPTPGYRFVEVDLNQAELRSLAALSGDPFLCSVYTSTGRSLHNEVAIEFFGPNYTTDQKIRAKAVNFGIVYGRQAPSIAEEFTIPTSEAQGYIDQWFARAPKARDFIQRCRQAAVKGETITTPFGRKKRHRLVTRENMHELQNEAANFPHQSIASDITLLSAVEVQDELASIDAYIVNLVHDSILVECPDTDEHANWVYEVIAAAMEQTPIDWGITRVPFKAESKIGYGWGDLKEVA